MKRLKYRLKRFTATVLMSLTLFTTTTNCYVQAAAIPILWGLAEIAGTLLFSAGVTYLGYQSIKNLTKDSDAYLDLTARLEADEDIAAMLEEIDSVDGTGALDNLAEGEAVEGTNFKVIQGGGNNTGIPTGKLSLVVSAGIVAKAAEIIQEFVESDANQYEITVDTPYSDILSTNYPIDNYSSINDIAALYGQEVVDRLAAKGWTDENCYVLLFKDVGYANNLSTIYTFIPIPFDCSFVGLMMETNDYYSNYSTALSVIPTEDFNYIFSSDMTNIEIRSYLENRRLDDLDAVYYDFVNDVFYDDLTSLQALSEDYLSVYAYLSTSNKSFYRIYDVSGYKVFSSLFNYEVDYGSHLIWRMQNNHVVSRGSKSLISFFPESFASYITLPETVPVVESAPVSMTFDSSTAATLEATPDLAESVNVTVELSPELADIKELLQESQVNDDENTDKVVSAIEAQTQGLLGGLGAVIVAALEQVLGLSDTDADTDVDADAGAVEDTDTTTPDNSGGDGSSSDSGGHVNILNGLLILIGIFFILLRIFIHCLQFIISIFQIPADPGFLSGDVLVGFEYIKTVELGTWGISIYDFLLGLIHISLLFGVIGVLKRHVDKIKI